jgi:C1A family cysteine protease
MPQQHSYGWVPDRPDGRDQRFSLRRLGITAHDLPTHVDLRMGCPPLYDQYNLGSCTAQAISAAIQFDEIKTRRPTEQPSALFIYWNTRAIEGTIGVDCGCSIRNAMKSINEYGHCEESQWPYVVSKFKQKPPQACYEYAKNHRSLIYESVAHDLNAIREVLAAGFPVIFGMMIHPPVESAQTAQTGVVGMPGPHDQPLGGHAVLAIGYDDDARLFLVRNSWGPHWGAQGNALLPYYYMMRPDTADFWVLRVGR